MFILWAKQYFRLTYNLCHLLERHSLSQELTAVVYKVSESHAQINVKVSYQKMILVEAEVTV